MSAKQSWRKLLDSFTDDVKVQENRVQSHVFSEDVLLRAPLGVSDNLVTSLLDVFQEWQRVT